MCSPVSELLSQAIRLMIIGILSLQLTINSGFTDNKKTLFPAYDRDRQAKHKLCHLCQANLLLYALILITRLHLPNRFV